MCERSGLLRLLEEDGICVRKGRLHKRERKTSQGKHVNKAEHLNDRKKKSKEKVWTHLG